MILSLALKKCIETDPWSIHGTWIDFDNGTYPSWCSHMDFEPLSPYQQAVMSEVWYNCDGLDEQLWDHELQKHGSCIRDYVYPYLSSGTYFNATVNIFQGYSSLCEILL